jgi:hypothetical protein
MRLFAPALLLLPLVLTVEVTLPYFSRDPGFAELLSHYRVMSRTTIKTY